MEIGGTSIAVPTLRTGSSLWRRAALDRLGHLRGGTLVIEDRGEEVRLGTPADDGLAARVVVRDPRLWRRLAMGGSAAAGASYADGYWDADDVTALVRLLSRNRDALAAPEQAIGGDGGVDLVLQALEEAGSAELLFCWVELGGWG
jgi:cyclopropane-fatty-acyl-phospholipid synthase